MAKTPTKIEVNALTDAMVRGGSLTKKGERWYVDKRVVKQAVVQHAAKERINLVEDEHGVWTFKPA